MNKAHIQQVLDGIAEPQTYRCKVCFYRESHSPMLIRMWKPPFDPDLETASCLGFESVWYFEGPMSWESVDFRLGTQDECLELLQKGWINLPEEHMIKLAEEYFHLFILERNGFRIRIGAAPINIQPKFPDISVHGL